MKYIFILFTLLQILSHANAQQYVSVTFQVDMSHVDTNTQGVYVAGGILGQDGLLLSNDGNDVWSVTDTFPVNTQIRYKFRNQPSYGTWEGFEDHTGIIVGGCGLDPHYERFVDVEDTNIVLPLVAYGSCTDQPFYWPLQLKGIIDFEGSAGSARGIHLFVTGEIYDLNQFSIEIYNEAQEVNLNGTATTGDNILVIRTNDTIPEYEQIYTKRMTDYLGDCYSRFQTTFVRKIRRMNGDDAIRLKWLEEEIEIYGVWGVDGSGESWEYEDSWAYKFESARNWANGILGCSKGDTTQGSDCPYPICASASVSCNDATATSGPCNNGTAINDGSSSSCIYLDDLTCDQWKKGYKDSACCSARI